MNNILNSQIQEQIKFLGKSLNHDLQNSSPVVFVCILNGAFIFFSDLMKQINIKTKVDFIRVKSYESQTQNEIQIIKDIEVDIAEKTVILVDDLVDSGNTLLKLIEHLQKFNPKEIKTVTLLKRQNSKFTPDYYAFHIHNNEWYYGYGMDLEGYNRNLSDILALEK